MKTNWKDLKEKPLRHPNSMWQLGHAADWFERLLGIPAGSVVFLGPDGNRVEPERTVRSLRRKLG